MRYFQRARHIQGRKIGILKAKSHKPDFGVNEGILCIQSIVCVDNGLKRNEKRTGEIRNISSILVLLYPSCMTTDKQSECGLSKEFNSHLSTNTAASTVMMTIITTTVKICISGCFKKQHKIPQKWMWLGLPKYTLKREERR